MGGAFVLAAQRLYPARAHRGQDRDPAAVPRGHALPDTGGRAPVRVHAGRLRARHAAAAVLRRAAADRAGQELLARHRDLAAAGGVLLSGARSHAGARPHAHRPRGRRRRHGRPHGGRADPRREPRGGDQRLRPHQPVRAPGVPGHGPRERDHDAHPRSRPAGRVARCRPPARRRAPLGRARPAAAGARGRGAARRRLRAGHPSARGRAERRGRARLAGRPESRRRGGGAAAWAAAWSA